MRGIKGEAAALATVVAFAVVIRVLAWIVWGPIYHFDTSDFVDLGKSLLENSRWLIDAELDSQLRAGTNFRMIGYPLLVGVAISLFGQGFDDALVALQSTASVISTILVFRVARVFGLNVAASAFSALAHTTSFLLIFDHSILVDSLFTNAILIPVLLIALGALRISRPSYAALLFLGALLTVAFLVRETAIFLLPFIAAGAALWAWIAQSSWRRCLIAAIAISLPMVTTAVAYSEWNRFRSGEAFLTTGAQWTMWFAPIEVARERGVAKVSDDPTIVAALERAVVTDPAEPGLGAGAINAFLFAEKKMRPTEIGRLAYEAFFDAARKEPLSFLKGRMKRFSPRAVLLQFNPTHTVEVMRDQAEWRPSMPYREKMRQTLQGDGSHMLALETLSEIPQLFVSALLLVAFMTGVPAALLLGLWRRQPIGSAVLMLGWFWLLYAALNGMYILASFEGRYAMATLPLSCVGGLWALDRLLHVFRTARNASYSRM